jgi:hypothetical protein
VDGFAKCQGRLNNRQARLSANIEVKPARKPVFHPASNPALQPQNRRFVRLSCVSSHFLTGI